MPQFRNIPYNAACYSGVSQPGERVLCVSVPEMVECGVSEGYLKKAFNQQRIGLVYCWSHHKEGREIFIHYDGLLDKYKFLINKIICNGIDAHLYVENREAAELERKLEGVKRSLRSMVEVSADELTRLSETNLYIPMDVQRIARAAGWLRLWRKMDVKTARKYGFASITEVQSEMFKQCLNEQTKGFVKFPKPINSERTLDRKAREYNKNGLDCLIAGYFGNVNREKMNTQTHAILMTLASESVKYSFEDIGMMYNGFAKENELPLYTVSFIRKHLNEPKHKILWYSARNGKNASNLVMQPIIDREPVSKPDLLWSLDGTTVQLYYKKLIRDDKGREKWKIMSDLYAYFVTDACTGAIIGSSVAFQEVSGMIIESLKDAVDTYGYIPYQMNYDNGSANISTVVTALVKNMSKVSFPCRPESGRSKTVESVIGHFQQRELRKLKNFKGGNITVKSINSVANPDVIKELGKHPELLPDETQVIKEFKAGIQAWNARGEKRDEFGFFTGKSKIERYKEVYEGRRSVDYFEKLRLFMVELYNKQDINGEYEYGQKGIELTIRGQKLKFIVPDANSNAMDFEFSRFHLREKFKVAVNLYVDRPAYIELRDRDGKIVADAWEKEKLASCVADAKNKPGEFEKIKNATLQQAITYGDFIKEIDLQREISALKPTGTDGYGTGWYDTPKALENTHQGVLEDNRNGYVEKTKQQIRLESLLDM